MTESSISFDRAADFYDETRALPPDVSERLTRAILKETRRAGAERLLEVGIGTGRIARPLLERGLPVTGVDISLRMMERLRQQLGPGAHPDLLLGDATRLPLAGGSFRAALFVHVLHLVPGWEAALAETRRVLAPDGVMLLYYERYESETLWGRRSEEKWEELLRERGFVRRRRPSREEIAAAIERLGGSSRVVTFAEDVDRNTPATILDLTRRRIHSWTWEIPEELFFQCLPEYESWLRREFDMDRELGDRAVYELEVWGFR
ncbi:MAG: class I SAM-dependent methyltransferase [Dehalococcoidia bacterium]